MTGSVAAAAALSGEAVAQQASVVTINVSGAGQVRLEPGGTCTAPLTTPTGVVKTCVVSTTGVGRPTEFGTAQEVRVWADTLGAAQGWTFTGWTPAPGAACAGAEATCRLIAIGACSVGGCTYSNLSITATFVDDQPPNTAITSKPDSVWVDEHGRATFAFTSGDPNAGFECRLTQGQGTPSPWSVCTSPKTYSGLADGAYTFEVRARDPSGNVDQSPDSWDWLEITPPDTRITSGPPDGGRVASRSATFGLASPKQGSAFECQLDGGAWAPCVPPVTYGGLSEGSHRFVARAVALGTKDPTPAVRSWIVDVTPPDTRLVSGPDAGALTNIRSATFALASEPGARFQCSLDRAPFASCSQSPTFHGLALGAHAFAARAVDGAGNADPTPVVRSWSITADLDGDGYIVPADCDDSEPAIHPGARDIPRDGVDQDCAKGDARFRPLPVRVRVAVDFLPAATRIASLIVEKVPARATLRVTCRAGRGSCPFQRRTGRTRRAKPRVPLTRLFRRVGLPQGTIVEVRITKRARLGSVTRLTMRNGRLPRRTEFCLEPRTGRRVSC